MRWCVAGLLCAAAELVAPAPAHAWFAWLDQLSGPGPFAGFDVQWRIACIADPAVPALALQTLEARRKKALEDALSKVPPLPTPPSGTPPRPEEAQQINPIPGLQAT